MSALKYVCLSDLHLGADYSVLTFMDPDGKTSLLRPSAALAAFGVALRETVSGLCGTEPPTLVLLGDVLDLGLSATGAVVQGFKQFIEALFPADAPPVFSTQVLCVPGNHDHHLWRAAQDQHFLDTLSDNWNKDFIPDLLQHTHLFQTDTLHCNLMTEAMRKYPHLKDATVTVGYPNCGFTSADRTRAVVLHHGHYIDAIYRALSTLNAELGGVAGQPKTSAQLERENGPWIDFLWSGLGGAGAIARDATALYETSRNAITSHAFAEKLSERLLAQLSAGLGVGANTEVTHGITVSNVVKGLVDVVLVRGAEMERDSYSSVMSASSLADLRWYIGGPVLRQIVQEGPVASSASLDLDLTFIFGHTHKPFQGELSVKGYVQPVAIYNTGGWVMDQPTMAPAQGAAAIFIDDALHVASLRLFNDSLNGPCAPVRAAGVGGFRDQDNPLLEQMGHALSMSAPRWDAFTAEASAVLATHAQVLLRHSLATLIHS